MYRFLLKPRWLVLHVLGVMLAVLFVNFGFWQLRRLEHRKTENALLETRLVLEPEPLSTLLAATRPDAPPSDPASSAYRPVTLTGRYDPANEVLLRGGGDYDGQPGYFVLTPLVLDSPVSNQDQAVLVERGWVPFELQIPPVETALPPGGEVTLTGVVQPEQKRPTGLGSGLTPRDPPGKLAITAYVDTDRLQEQMPYDLLPLYVELRAQSPVQANPLPLPLKPPEFGNGPHLGYALQWFSFTLIGVVGYVFVVRGVARARVKQDGRKTVN
ncbi:SURF1 family protein [soil metagenome]